MTASPDDAAASSVPPRAGGGPAAPSFSGTSGPRTPEDSPMTQRPVLSDDTVRHERSPDETVRMRGDGPDRRPALDGQRPEPAAAAPEGEVDDTRPVTRDWLLGAPDGPLDASAPPVGGGAARSGRPPGGGGGPRPPARHRGLGARAPPRARWPPGRPLPGPGAVPRGRPPGAPGSRTTTPGPSPSTPPPPMPSR